MVVIEIVVDILSKSQIFAMCRLLLTPHAHWLLACPATVVWHTDAGDHGTILLVGVFRSFLLRRSELDYIRPMLCTWRTVYSLSRV